VATGFQVAYGRDAALVPFYLGLLLFPCGCYWSMSIGESHHGAAGLMYSIYRGGGGDFLPGNLVRAIFVLRGGDYVRTDALQSRESAACRFSDGSADVRSRAVQVSRTGGRAHCCASNVAWDVQKQASNKKEGTSAECSPRPIVFLPVLTALGAFREAVTELRSTSQWCLPPSNDRRT